MLDEPSLGLAPLIVKEIFHIISALRQTGVATLLIEQNARAALQISDYGYVLETGEFALEGAASGSGAESSRHRNVSGAGEESRLDSRSTLQF